MYQTITFLPSIDADWGNHPDLVDGRGYGQLDHTGNVLVVVYSIQRSSEGRQKSDGILLSWLGCLIVVANWQERRCDRQHRVRSRVDHISGHTNSRGKGIKSGSNTSVVPVSYSCTNIVLAVLDRQRSGVKATIWWFCHDHERSGRSVMIGNIGKEWLAQCDLGLSGSEFMYISQQGTFNDIE